MMNLWLNIVSIILIILLPLALAASVYARHKVPWLYFFVGLGTFLSAQVIHLPLNHLLTRIGLLPETAEGGSALIQAALILGLTAGLTEELARAAGYALVKRARGYFDGAMLGLGHGGIEALLIAVLAAAGVSSLWYLQNLDALPAGASLEQIELLKQQLLQVESIPLVGLLPFVERVVAITLHIGLSIMVLQAFTGRKRGVFFIISAILYHALVDFVAVVGVRQVENPWLLEGLLVLTVLPLAIWAWRSCPSIQMPRSVSTRSLSKAVKLFLDVFAKELRFQWRTRRAIIVVVVFLVFGMTSPLLAKFTPELLSSLEGAEQFAEFIPEPTVKDAVAQYLSNLTQFGFILVILLGMGAVAGEKEKGTAAMILSKPLPRWIFLWGKYAAQGTVYLLAIIPAAISAYFYTLYLFEALPIGSFIAANFLLYLWFMVYASVTLLGSTLGRTTGAAAGLAALASVILLVASTIPTIGGLAPGGLVAWAGQLMNSAETAPNGGSVIMVLVIIILALLGAVAALDEQEI